MGDIGFLWLMPIFFIPPHFLLLLTISDWSQFNSLLQEVLFSLFGKVFYLSSMYGLNNFSIWQPLPLKWEMFWWCTSNVTLHFPVPFALLSSVCAGSSQSLQRGLSWGEGGLVFIEGSLLGGLSALGRSLYWGVSILRGCLSELMGRPGEEPSVLGRLVWLTKPLYSVSSRHCTRDRYTTQPETD